MSCSSVAFEIPHVWEKIAQGLSFQDLFNCLRTCRQWNHGFIPILWKDHITYRSQYSIAKRDFVYDDYTSTQHGIQALTSHAHHIHALTCYGREALQILSQVDCSNVSEINYTPSLRKHLHEHEYDNENENPDEDDPGLQELANWIRKFPQVKAVSVEFQPDSNLTKAQVDLFLDTLDQYPSITSVHLDADQGDHLYAIREHIHRRLLARIQQSVSIRTLHVVSSVPRSKRAMTDEQPFPARETPITVKIADLNTFFQVPECRGGRWEAETRHTYFNKDTVSVLQNRDALEVCMCTPSSLNEWKDLLERFPNLETLQIDKVIESDNRMLSCIPELLPNLSVLEIRHSDYNTDTISRLFDKEGLPKLSRIVLAASRPVPAILQHRAEALTHLRIYTQTLREFYETLESCPNLQVLDIQHQTFRYAEIRQDVTIACRGLRSLMLNLDYKNTQPHLLVSLSPMFYGLTMPAEPESDYAASMAGLLTQTIASLTELQELRLGFNLRGQQPFLKLSLDNEGGLPQLQSLQKLRSLSIAGVEGPKLGPDEIVWMKQNWTSLRYLFAPIERQIQDGPRGEEMGHFITSTIEVHDFKQWFPELKVVIPIQGCLYDEIRGYWHYEQLDVAWRDLPTKEQQQQQQLPQGVSTKEEGQQGDQVGDNDQTKHHLAHEPEAGDTDEHPAKKKKLDIIL
ncbi:hypothetical protein BG004_006145 [Podila humilis]|nr:hypothetical protein BG004_006145 [Podila humilis]